MNRTVKLAGAVAALALMATGCGLGGEPPSQSQNVDVEPGSIKPIDNLKGAEIAVGSKDFTEQLILGEMSIAVLEAAGAKPVDKTKITGTQQVRDALETGEIDMYWEYLGTAWSVHLGHEEQVSDTDELYNKIKTEDEQNGIVWLPYSPLINTYAIATSEENAERLGVSKLSDLKTLPEDELTFCLGTEFAGRPQDGFKPMLEAYGIEPSSIPTANVHQMGDALVYGEVDKGEQCNFASTFSSDGRIATLGLKVLDDDKPFFPLYNAAVNINAETYEQYPELEQVFNPVSEKLTTEVLQDLNGQVDEEGKQPEDVAREWLQKEGFIG